MSDKEVGGIWRFVQTNPGNMTRQQREWFIGLIRKLVEERAWRRWGGVVNGALRDFGIDPASWTGGE